MKEIEILDSLYMSHFAEKKDSFKHCTIEFLYLKFQEELEEYYLSKSNEETLKELYDVILVAIMIAYRIRNDLPQEDVTALYNTIMKNRK
jgi:hypothetical protein